MRANYTYSKAIDKASDFVQAQQANDPYTPSAERSVSTEDQRHRFTLTGFWEIPYRSAAQENPVLRGAVCRLDAVDADDFSLRRALGDPRQVQLDCRYVFE